MSDHDPVFSRLEDQIKWYDNKSVTNQKFFKSLRGTMIVAAALIPLFAGIEIAGTNIPLFVTGILGVMVVVLEGFQMLYQFHDNWIRYRSTCEQLKHEKYLFLGEAGPYSGANNPRALLAERVESMVSQEHAKWTSAQEQIGKSRS